METGRTSTDASVMSCSCVKLLAKDSTIDCTSFLDATHHRNAENDVLGRSMYSPIINTTLPPISISPLNKTKPPVGASTGVPCFAKISSPRCTLERPQGKYQKDSGFQSRAEAPCTGIWFCSGMTKPKLNIINVIMMTLEKQLNNFEDMGEVVASNVFMFVIKSNRLAVLRNEIWRFCAEKRC